MSLNHTTRTALIVLAAGLALSALLITTGCGDSADDAETSQGAKAGLAIAQSALETMAPDAKLLVVETAEGVTPTSTPVWAYLFGSPEDDKTYVVYVSDGQAMNASEYGTAGLSEEEWSQVPGTDDWKIDNDEAYEKALEISGAEGDPAAYYMGFQTYVPEAFAATSTVSAFTWYVSFDPGESGASTDTVAVDATTGEAEKAAE
ncbi:MAG: hypothetical protein CVT60_02115 [Actinobacteria bacterium HGW-Actinobacteria-10]|jgi:hypothetical protein|nr:MAG: hypothetical protein CVT60_02115 [Actinobacteria bacterium HGW-Actinobacteria-10]